MRRYIDTDEFEKRIKPYDTYDYMDKALYNFAHNKMMETSTADAVEIKKEGEWEMFDLISSAYYGKGMYFKQDDGNVYSRYSCKYMSVDEAIREFVSLIDDSDFPIVVERKKGKWITVFVEYPNKTEVISECPICGQWFKDRTYFCPNCGAEMG